ncbi:TRAP transporter small permease [Phytoactinopolyspora endophytica]|uniref:TRAP transporter small permease n=1 Tax=Phytoactinopolyspora endophytica TaxID=1642495 RepID=UPI00101C6B42|nr:TRAP transporter small permease [Phytoactinopolyspora endophytica]
MPHADRRDHARRIVDRVTSALDVLQRTLVIALVAILSALALLLIWQVFDRLVLGGGQNWVEESARLSLVWLTFLGAAALLRERKHLTVEYFVDKFPPRVRRAITVAVDMCLAVFLTVLLCQIPAVWASSSVLVSPSLGIPRTALALAAFISFGIGLLYCLESLARQFLHMPDVRQITTDPSDERADISV